MNSPSAHRTGPTEDNACLARSVVDTLAEEPTLEAVTIDRAQQKISVATLGRTDAAKLTERISSQFQAAQEVGHPTCAAAVRKSARALSPIG